MRWNTYETCHRNVSIAPPSNVLALNYGSTQYHHHQSGCFSHPKKEPLYTYSTQLPVFLNVTQHRSYISDQVFAPSRSWSASGSLMSTGYPFFDSDCPSVAMSPRHATRPSAFAFSHVPDNVCHTTLFAGPVCTIYVLQGDSYHDSLHLALACVSFFKLGVAKRPSLTAICHYWNYISIYYLVCT